MDYLCLAAGRGTRFGRLGVYLQKCMYPVGLRPFLECTLQSLLQVADPTRDRLTVVVGHHGEQVRAYFGTAFEGLELHYLEQPDPLGTGHALYLAYQALHPTDALIAWLADAYVSAELFARVKAHPEPNVQTVGPGEPGEKQDLRVTTAGERVLQAWQGAEPLYDVGLWRLEPAVLAHMTAERHGEYRMVPNLQRAIDLGHRVGVVRTDEWLHLGGTQPTPEQNVIAVSQRVLELAGAA